jgi:hypothetical protein
MKLVGSIAVVAISACTTAVHGDEACNPVLAYGAGRGSISLETQASLQREYDNVCQGGASKGGTSLSAQIFSASVGFNTNEEAHTAFCRTFNREDFYHFFRYNDVRQVDPSIVEAWRDCERFNAAGKPYHLELLQTQFTITFTPSVSDNEISLTGFSAVPDDARFDQPVLSCQISVGSSPLTEFNQTDSKLITRGEGAVLICKRSEMSHPVDGSKYFPAITVAIANNARMPGIKLPERPSGDNPSDIKRLQAQADELRNSIVDLKAALRSWGGSKDLPGDLNSSIPARNLDSTIHCPKGSFAVGIHFDKDGIRQQLVCREMNTEGSK